MVVMGDIDRGVALANREDGVVARGRWRWRLRRARRDAARIDRRRRAWTRRARRQQSRDDRQACRGGEAAPEVDNFPHASPFTRPLTRKLTLPRNYRCL